MSSLGVKPEKMKRTRKPSKRKETRKLSEMKKGERVKKIHIVANHSVIPDELILNVDEFEHNLPHTASLKLFGSLTFRITNLNEEGIFLHGGGWGAGKIEILENGIHWEGIKTDINMCGVTEIDWEVFKEIVQISAQDCGPVKYKPFEEIHGKDIKVSNDGNQCIICQDNIAQCANTGCGHMIFCINCANKFTKEKENACPVCRRPIEKLIRII